MANPVHLEVLKQGVKVWNQWRQSNILVLPDLSEANLSGVDLSEANLSEANLIRANLSRAELIGARLIEANLIEANLREANLFGAELTGADLNRASLSEANLIGARLNGAALMGADLIGVNLIQASLSETDLTGADLSGANLKQADLRGANFSKASLSKANLAEADLIGANLWEAGLRDANLTGANLWEADLRGTNLMGTKLVGVDLREANLLQVTALDTDLSNAILTGACIQDWVINHTTKLDGVECDYVYLRYDYNLPGRFLDRRPINANRSFAPQEFIQLLRRPFDTLDLIFTDGIDWKAFFLSFQQLRHHYGAATLAIQAIERQAWGGFIVRLEVDQAIDRRAIEVFAQELYDSHIQALEIHYQERFQLQGSKFEAYLKKLENQRLENTQIDEIIETQVVLQDRILETIATDLDQIELENSPSLSLMRKQTSNALAFVKVFGTSQATASEESPQALAKLAQVLQNLLDDLSKTHAVVVVPAEAEQMIQATPDLKNQILTVVKAGKQAILESLVHHPAIGVVLAAAETWN